MKFESFLIKDTGGKKSLTATAFVLGFVLASTKFFLAGCSLGALTLAPMSGVDYGASIAALGAIYVLRRTGDEGKTK